MKQSFYERLGESVYRETLPNGLQIYVVPKPGYAKKYAFFATRYGGMDTRFCLNGQWLDTPAGIAHYLEHKMFDTKEGNALQELAKNGAEPNAFTSNAMTGYYFDSTDHFEENLEILLSFVSIPYFTEESVAKEQGIITVSSGIEFENYQKAYDEIMAQLDAVRNGDLEDWELDGARSTLLNAYASMGDSQGKLENFYLGQAATGQSETPEELAEQVRNVTPERIFNAMKSVELDTVYFLRGKEAAE